MRLRNQHDEHKQRRREEHLPPPLDPEPLLGIVVEIGGRRPEARG